MIVLDLDGTLLNSKKEITKKTLDLLNVLHKNGHILVIATGRILNDVLNLIKNINCFDYIISDTGGLIYDIKERKVIFKNIINKNDLKEMYEIAHDESNYISLGTEENYNIINKDGKTKRIFDKIIGNVYDFIDTHDVIHISIKEINKFNEMYEYLVNKFPYLDFYIFQDSFSEKKWIEMPGKGVNKYNSIKMIANIVNIENDDIIAFGDGINDLDMLKNCGVGVAMYESLKEVQDKSDFVTLSNEEDGVIEFLKAYLT